MNGFVELITGTLGGGKTLFAVQRMFEHVARGGHVWSNIQTPNPRFPDSWARHLAERHGRKFDPARLVTMTGEQTLAFQKHVPRGTKERAVMVVIDEAGLEFNAKDHAKMSIEQLALNTYARKLELQVLYITQQSADMYKQFRGKCRCEWQCRNLFNQRFMGVIPVKIPLLARVCYDCLLYTSDAADE